MCIYIYIYIYICTCTYIRQATRRPHCQEDASRLMSPSGRCLAYKTVMFYVSNKAILYYIILILLLLLLLLLVVVVVV